MGIASELCNIGGSKMTNGWTSTNDKSSSLSLDDDKNCAFHPRLGSSLLGVVRMLSSYPLVTSRITLGLRLGFAGLSH